MKWLSERDLEAPGVRLFCLPHAGSGTAGFYRWKRLLPQSIAVCPVMLPGRESRLAEASLTNVQDIVNALDHDAKAWLDRPYAVFGHSMGSLLAYEWARNIEAKQLPLPQCLFVSGRNAPQMPPSHRKLHELPDNEFVRELRQRYGGDGDALLTDPELREIFLPILRADIEVVETYQHQVGDRLSSPMMAFAGIDDKSVSDSGLSSWTQVTHGAFTEKRFSGDHFYPFAASQLELLRTIAEGLTT